jgi:FtsZ-interacting cell division protein ZipA
MEVFHAIIATLAIILFIHIARFMSKKDDRSGGVAQDVRVARNKAKPMATPSGMPAMRPAFAEETDWSEFDEPAYLRKQMKKTAQPKKVDKVQEIETPAETAQPKADQQQKPRRRSTPKEQMDDFKKHVKNRRSEQSATYEEI